MVAWFGKSAIYVPCYADYVGGGRFLPPPVPATAQEDAAALEVLLEIEGARNAAASTLGPAVAVLDRSVHTLLAHRRAVGQMYGQALEQQARRAVEASPLVAWPDLVLYLDIPQALVEARSHPKFPPGSVFVAADFNAEFRQYFTGLAASKRDAVAWLDAAADPAAVLTHALQALDAL
ncbi:MAG: hypothetical protein M3524_05415 [Actinomycetota bacterium]|nr:hypothetical protein [Actinomycetota bacterium]